MWLLGYSVGEGPADEVAVAAFCWSCEVVACSLRTAVWFALGGCGILQVRGEAAMGRYVKLCNAFFDTARRAAMAVVE